MYSYVAMIVHERINWRNNVPEQCTVCTRQETNRNVLISGFTEGKTTFTVSKCGTVSIVRLDCQVLPASI